MQKQYTQNPAKTNATGQRPWSWQGLLRSLFAFAFPLILGMLFYMLLTQTSFYLNSKAELREKAETLELCHNYMSRIHREFSLTAQIEKEFRKIIDKFYACDRTDNLTAMRQFAEIYSKNMPAEFAENSQIWGFTASHSRFDILKKEPFMLQKQGAMKRAFSAIVDIISAKQKNSSARAAERFISGVFGENSVAEYLASTRSGKLTPVVFEGQQHYLYWYKLERLDNCIGGIIALFKADWIENRVISLKRLSRQIYQESDGKVIPVFAQSAVIDKKFVPVIADEVAIQPETDEITGFIGSIHGKNSAFPARQLQQSGNFWLYRDSIADVSPYYGWLVSRRDHHTVVMNASLQWLSIILAILWILLFWKKSKNSQFELAFAFKLLFFMTGMLPVTMLLLFGAELIDQAGTAQINARIESAFSRLKNIDEKSEDLTSLAGIILKEVFSSAKLQKQLISQKLPENQQGFRQIEQMLQQHHYALSYLLINRPGEESIILGTTPENSAIAGYHNDYYAISCSIIHQQLAGTQTAYRPIILTPSQKTIFKSFGGESNAAIHNIFFSSLEHIYSLESDNQQKHLVYSTILSQGNKIAGYLVTGLNTASTLLKMIIEEMRIAEKEGENLFVCLNRETTAGQKIYPPRHNRFISSEEGQVFKKFLEAAAASNYQMQLRRPDAVYLYMPFPRIREYYAGAVVEIKDIIHENELKRLLLAILAALLAGSIYLISTYVSSLIIKPTEQLDKVFSTIAQGSFATAFTYRHDNELGMLARATDSMISGLKERKLLGRFVSKFFDSEVLSLTDTGKARELYGVILFSDIRNFTTLSESNSAEIINEMLNSHLKEMVEIIIRHQGEVEQFIGDAIVAFFPGEGEKVCQAAITAAEAMMLQQRKINIDRKQQKQLTCEIGIGLDYGLVMAGVLTSGSRSEFSVIGPARAHAEKFESLSKSGRYTKIIVSHSLIANIGTDSKFFEKHADDCCELRTFRNKP